MDAEQRQTLRHLVTELRRVLEGEIGPAPSQALQAAQSQRPGSREGDLHRQLRALGVHPDRVSLGERELGSEAERCARRSVERRLAPRVAAGQSRAAALEGIVGETAYGWANRLLALRCLEARELRDEVIVRRAVYGSRSLAHHRLAQRHPERCVGEDDGLFEVLTEAFAAEAERLPVLFDPCDEALGLRPSVAALGRCIALLSGAATVGRDRLADTALFRDPTTLGWAYQFWNTEHKDAIFDRLRARTGLKLAGAELAAATQLYTAPHLVRFLVQNALGSKWLAMHPGSRLGEQCEVLLGVDLPVATAPKRARELSLLDPACGSGHFLLEAFDLFYALYQEEGELRRPEDICRAILEHNLHGIDVDPRAVQLCEAALWMKAAERGVELRPIRTQLVATNFLLGSEDEVLGCLLRERPDWERFMPRLRALCRCLGRAPELGALLDVDRALAVGPGPEPDEVLGTLCDASRSRSAPSLPDVRSCERARDLVRLLGRRYDVVVTNPPYAGFRTLAPHLKDEIVDADPDVALDLYVAFLSRFFDRLEPGGLLATVTPASWTTSIRTVALRRRISRHGAPVVVVALGQRVFEAAPLLFVALAVVARGLRLPDSRFVTLHPAAASGSEGLRRAVRLGGRSWPCALLDELEAVPLLPEAPPELLVAARHAPSVGSVCRFQDGIWTGSSDRDVREGWELAPLASGWVRASGGQGYARWYAATRRRIRVSALRARQPSGETAARRGARPEAQSSAPSEPDATSSVGTLEYSRVAGGKLSARLGGVGVAIAGVVRIVPRASAEPGRIEEVAAVFNSRLGLGWLRTLSSGLNFNPGYAARIPLSPELPRPELTALVRRAIELKRELVRWDPTGDDFVPALLDPRRYAQPLGRFIRTVVRAQLERTAALLEVETQVEQLLSERYGLSGEAACAPGGLSDSDPERRSGLPAESALEARARQLGVAPCWLMEQGALPGGRVDETAGNAEQVVPRAAEALWAEESERVLGDYLDVLVLRALGHHWPADAEPMNGQTGRARDTRGAGAPPDGIVPLTKGTGRPTALELVRAALAADFPASEPAEPERELARLGIDSLEHWIEKRAFARHVERFSRRPVLWELASGSGGRRRSAAFACWLHVHRLDGDTLPKLATELVQPLRQRLREELERLQSEAAPLRAGGRDGKHKHRARLCEALRQRLEELERFESRLRAAMATGFGFEGLAAALGDEPLDRLCAPDGRGVVPLDRQAWVESEARYLPAQDDGIRVNLAPLQKARLLAREVLAPKQVARAIADRARWRAESRQACRRGQLAQPPWWAEPARLLGEDGPPGPEGEP